MAYSSQDQLVARITEQTIIDLTDDSGSGIVDSTKVAAAIARADQEIDAWCGSRYRVPFATPPAVVSGLSADLAIYYLHARTQGTIPEAIRESHKNVTRLLEKISDGKVSLGVDPAPAASTTGNSAEIIGPERIFNRDKLGGGF